MLTHALVPGRHERAHSGHRGDGPRLVQPNDAAQLDRLPAFQARAAHLATHAVEYDFGTQVVPVRAGLAEVGDGGHHHSGIDGLQRAITETQSVHRPRPETLHHDVRVLCEPACDLPGGLGLQVEGDAALVGVKVQEKPAPLQVRVVFGKGTQPAGAVASAEPLDLHDVGAIVCQKLGAVGPRYVVGEV